MSQTITTIDLIRRAMYLINAVAAGEIPDDEDLNDGLLTLNEMLDSWDLQPMAVFGSPNESWTLAPGQSVYTWGTTAGPTGFTSERPVQINGVTCVRGGVSYPVEIITQDQYDAIMLKATASAIVERVLYVNDYPLGQLTCYPVPTEAVTLNFNTARQLNGPVTLQDTLAFPPGYLRALRYNLAVDLWPEYTNTTTDIESIKKIAKESFGKVKVANQVDTPATFGDVPGVGGFDDWRANYG
jgi:hypothetical protein